MKAPIRGLISMIGSVAAFAATAAAQCYVESDASVARRAEFAPHPNDGAVDYRGRQLALSVAGSGAERRRPLDRHVGVRSVDQLTAVVENREVRVW